MSRYCSLPAILKAFFQGRWSLILCCICLYKKQQLCMWYFALVHMAQRNWYEKQLQLHLSFFNVQEWRINVGLTGKSNVLLFLENKVYIKTLAEIFCIHILLTDSCLSFLDTFSHATKLLARFFSPFFINYPKNIPVFLLKNNLKFGLEKEQIFCLSGSYWDWHLDR